MLKVIFNTSKKKRKNTNVAKRTTHAAPISCWFATCVFAVKRFILVVMDAHGISTFLKLVRITELRFIAT